MDWLKRNKALTGFIMAILTYFVKSKCPFIPPEWCEPLSNLSGLISSFLVGSGLMDSDTREKYVQGILEPPKEK